MQEARAILSHFLLGSVVAATTCSLMPDRADAHIANLRLIEDGCDVGGRGNDIQAIESHYEADSDRIVVTLRLCAEARPKTTYRIHLDHAAPFVGSGRAQAGCVAMADTVIVRTPAGHRGVGSSTVEGNAVRFVVPLAKLHLRKPRQQPLIALWATSSLGNTEDRAPNRETGDGCAEPQATTETLVQARVAITGGLAFVSSYSFTGAIGPSATVAINVADLTCQQQAANAGYADTGGIHAWLTNLTSNPATHIFDPGFGPIQTPDGTVVANSISDFQNCDPGAGNQCLLAPIDKDIQGNLITDNFVWTATLPNVTNPGASLDDCDGWTSDSAGADGDGGVPTETNAGFTTGVEDSCSASHAVLCVQFE